jgi:hypothetical protein
MKDVAADHLDGQEVGHSPTHRHDAGPSSHPMGSFFQRHERLLLLCILGVSLLAQLPLAPYHGFFIDMQYYTRWGQFLLSHPSTFYTITKSNYPPLMMYIFAGADLTYGWLAHLFGLPPMYTSLNVHQAPTYSFMWLWAKLVIILCNTGTAFLIYRLVRPITSARWALLATLAYGVAPTMLFEGALWGQTDGVPIFYLLLALLAVREEKFGWAGVSLGIMLMLKLQPAIFLPVILLYVYGLYEWRKVARLLLTFIATMAVICLPMAFTFPPQILALYANTRLRVDMNQANGFNLWFLFKQSISQQSHYIGPVSATAIGYALFLPIILFALALVWYRRSFTSLFLALSLIAVGFFAVTTYQHERYMVQSLALLLVASAGYRPCLRIFVGASITTFYNVSAESVPSSVNHGIIYGIIGWGKAFLANLPSGTTALASWVTLELLAGLILMCIWYMQQSARRNALQNHRAEGPSSVEYAVAAPGLGGQSRPL